ncbi:MAG: formate--tetrahydrofolate ligase [Alkalispirochaetaceae bacterium]
MLSDIEIAQAANLKEIGAIAAEQGLQENELIPYGRSIAKVDLSLFERLERPAKDFRYIDVTAITPTPFGEGKTTTTVGLTQGLGHIGKKASCAIRQASMGPTFGIKGGAAGGGYSQIVPMEDFNLHLTGDIHAVSVAHNLVAAAIDARLYHESRWSDAYFEKNGIPKLDLDPYAVAWNRVVDINDRALRNLILGLGDKSDGPLRQGAFDIAVASELMAVLALATGLKDLRERVGRIVAVYDKKGKAVTLEDMQVAGAVTVLLKEALKPNMMQTLEGEAAFVHTGPFANIAHGNSSVLADLVGSRLGGYLVTESGFGSDIGMEKFFDIKCRASGLMPNAVVMVATVRALKMHGGGPAVKPGRPLDSAYTEENLELLSAGLDNLRAHVENAANFGVPVVVAINGFQTDSEKEWKAIEEAAVASGASAAVVTTHFAEGGKGAAELAEAVVEACEKPSEPKFLYDLDLSINEKIEKIATTLYGASSVDYTPEARKKIDQYTENGWDKLPICVAKTPLSLSHDPAVKGRPKDYSFPVRDIRASVGAGFLYPLAGDIRTMPGLPSKPAFMGIDIDVESGKILGLS